MPLDFSHQKLQGRFFIEEDLTGADFSYSDIRGTDFSRATLRGANFTGAKAGLQGWWAWMLLGVPFGLSFPSGLFSAFASLQIGYYLSSEAFQNSFIIAITGLVVFITFCVILLLRGLKAALVFFTTIFALSITFGLLSNTALTVAYAMSLVIASMFMTCITIASSIAISGYIASVFSVIFILSGVISGNTLFPNYTITSGSITITYTGVAVTFFLSIAIVLLAGYISRRTLLGDEEYTLIRKLIVAISATGGTNFYNSDLTEANFTKATLRSVDLREAKITRTCWHQTHKLAYARTGESYLSNRRIRQLVTTGQGQNADFNREDLRGTNLCSANLEYTTFIDADLSQANLQGANLFETQLVRTNLDQADLSRACLTGAYIQDWGITRKTKFDGVECKYIYLQFPTKNNRDPNRMPPSEQGDFNENDFNIFITSVLDTLDLYHKHNIDAGVAVTVLKGLTKDYPVQFEIVGLEKRGNDQFLIKLKVFGQASHFELQREYYARYEQTLPLYDPKKLLPDTDIVVAKIIETVKQNPGTRIENLHNQGIFVTEGTFNMVNQSSNEGNNVYVGGNVTGSTINLGEISGSVSNVVNQLPSSLDPTQPGIKELLIQLQQAVDEDTDLPPEDKADLLEQVKALAEAGQTPEQEKKKGLVRNARKIFDATLKSLPDTANIIEACSKLFPLILKALGLPA